MRYLLVQNLFFKKAFLFLSLLLFLLAFQSLAGQDLGVVGKTYEILEEDLVEVFKRQAQASVENGKWDSMLKEGEKNAKSYAKRPPGTFLPRATESKFRRFNPTLIMPSDIRDAEGRLLYPAGTQVNPLQVKSFTKTLAFFDADDLEQVTWANNNVAKFSQIVPILVRGEITSLSQSWNRQIFFDQGGRDGGKLIHHFGINSLPSLVYQKTPSELWLTIEEVDVTQANASKFKELSSEN